MGVVFPTSFFACDSLEEMDHLVGHHYPQAIKVLYARFTDTYEMDFRPDVACVMPLTVTVAGYSKTYFVCQWQLPSSKWRAFTKRTVDACKNFFRKLH